MMMKVFLFLQLNCCGFNNFSDFIGSSFTEQNGDLLPPSCCWTHSAPCSPAQAERSNVQVRWKHLEPENIWNISDLCPLCPQGCFHHILDSLKEHANIVGGIAAGIGVLEVKL